jgi:hypothetical protein
MKIIAMIDRSAGNESVGEMWVETKSFDQTASLSDVYEWVAIRASREGNLKEITTNVKLSIDQSE